MLNLKDIELKNKRVLVRSDLNVPIVNGKIADDERILASIPTYKYILSRGGSLTIMSHLGRPNILSDDHKEFSLAPIAPMLAKLLEKEVCLLQDFNPGFNFESGKVYLYENTRLIAGEKECDADLAKKMASCCDVFVMDAFASCHRQDSSTYGVVEYAKQCCAGLLLEQEVNLLTGLLESPDSPMVAVIGGSKISGKIDVIMSLLEVVDHLVVVGAMANTFLAALGHNVGKSLYEPDKIELAKNILDKKKASCHIPEDVVVLQADKRVTTKDISMVADDDTIYDIGTKSINTLKKVLDLSKTLLWNGPLGLYEDPRFANGGISFAKIVAHAAINSIVGGGDTIAVIKSAGVYDNMSYVSTGGGAFLALLEGKKLPCIEKLYERGNKCKDAQK